MTDADANRLPDDFAGTVRLFPLPNLVLFPHVVQPLHIFEPRYREMLEDSLADDQLMAIALLQPGWESNYDERPSIFSVTCIGRVVSHSQLEDGRYNLLLLGLRRASVIRELPPTSSYRMAEVAVLEDVYSETSGSRRVKLQRDLTRCFRRLVAQSPAAQEQLDQLIQGQLPLGVLTDIISYSLDFELSFKQKLLTEWNVEDRAAMLLGQLQSLAENRRTDEMREQRPFPPDFSAN